MGIIMQYQCVVSVLSAQGREQAQGPRVRVLGQFVRLLELPQVKTHNHHSVGVPRLLLGYHDLYQTQMTTKRVIWTLATFSTHQGYKLGQKGMVVVLGNQGNNWGTIEPTQRYLNTLQGVQGFCHCPKGSKGFKLGLGQDQKVSLNTDI